MQPKTLPKGWEWVRLSDVAKQYSNHEHEPREAGIERYVGLDALDPYSLRITRWGDVADGTSFTKSFRPGHVLFAKRRVYQKKAAVADFTGLCSGDIIVIEAKEDRLLPELLPFIVQSDAFFDFAEKHSAGGLSPRTKWSSISKFEMPLPPMERQQELVEVFQSVEEMLIHVEKARRSSIRLHTSLLLDFSFRQHGIDLRLTGDEEMPQGWRVMSLGELVTRVQYGLSLSSGDEGQYPLLRMPNIHEGRIDVSDLKYVDLEPEELNKYRLEPGDIVFNRTNSIDLVGKTALFDQTEDFVFASYLLRVNVDEERALPEYINYFLNLPHIQARLRALATPGASQANINPTSLKSVRVVLPPLTQQREIVDALSSVRATTKRVESHERRTGTLKRALLNELLRPSPVQDEAGVRA